MAEIFYTVASDLHRMARVAGGLVQEIDFEIPENPPSLWGGIYLGRVVETQKPLQAAFVDIGQTQLGLLPLREGKLTSVTHGETVLVQVTRTANPLDAKGVRLTRLITLSLGPLLYTPFTPGLSLSKKIKNREFFKNLLPLLPEEGLIVRFGATESKHLLDLLSQLRKEWETIQQQLAEKPPFCVSPPSNLLTRVLRSLSPSDTLVIDDRAVCLLTKGKGTYAKEKAFDDVCEETWDSLSSTTLAMPEGGNLSIEETKALVAIDVNSQGALKHVLSFNRSAIKECLRQIHLRDLGGKIVIDLIGAPQELAPLLQGLTIPSNVEIFGLSPLHLLELIRRRRRLSLPQRLKLQIN
ncbi:MAG: ribonuclease E/G [Alphaproteobacteria bacterium]|nr:ribonuclease E/G [Alphaproteobacteria bacterium]